MTLAVIASFLQGVSFAIGVLLLYAGLKITGDLETIKKVVRKCMRSVNRLWSEVRRGK